MTKAPHFTLPNQDGQAVSLADFTGKRVLLFFFPKVFTPGCTIQACGFRDRFPEIAAHDGVVLGISPDSPIELAKWKAALNLPYTLLSDADHQVAAAYGAWGERSLFGHKYQGIIRSHFVIDEEGNLAQSVRKVAPKDSVRRGTQSLIRAA